MKLNFSHIKQLLIASLVLGLSVSCSQQKNTWANRNFHAMGAYYNTLYNGKLAMKKGKEKVRKKYTDNFWTILPVHRDLKTKDSSDQLEQSNSSNQNQQKKIKNTPKNLSGTFSASRPGSQSKGGKGIASGNSNQQSSGGGSAHSKFKRAEKKATKAIQKHNMLINGTEYNYKIDRAFLMLGKARYYDGRYIEALEAFNYILTKYKKSNQLARAKIWREKTYLQLHYYDLALSNLEKLLNEYSLEELENKDYVNAYASIAQAYIDLEEPKKVLNPLDTAIKYTEVKRKKGRYLFIKGQLLDSLDQPQKANKVYNKVIDFHRQIPRKYYIHAHLRKALNYNLKTQNPAILEEHLLELAADRENRSFLDIIYYRIAEFYQKTDQMPKAIKYYNKSLRTGTQDRRLRYRIYRILGNTYFDRAEYLQARKYYDSTLTNLKPTTRLYLKIKSKRDNLKSVIKYERIAHKTDSILNLVRMSPTEQEAYFTQLTDSLRKSAIARAKKQHKQANRASSGSGNFFGRKQNNLGTTSSGGSFYFYDRTRRKMGVQTFKRRWGDRPLQDNWRYKTEGGPSKDDSKSGKEEKDRELDAIIAQIKKQPQFQPSHYIKKIPTDSAVIDSISDERNFAYYQLGIIYKENFREYQLAIDKLTGLLQSNPKERLILPSKYYLYKIYKTIGNKAKANQWKQDILTNHPDSRYANILRNPRSLRDLKDSPLAVYNRIYKKYKQGKYGLVIEQTKKYIRQFTGEQIVPKLELLKAFSKGRYYGFKAYKKALNYVALKYPQSSAGKKAQQMLDETLPAIANKGFSKAGENFKLIYAFPAIKRQKAKSLKKQLDQAFAELGYGYLSTSLDLYTPHKIFVVVHGLSSKQGSEGLGKRLKKNEKYQINHKSTGISSRNYRTVLIHKNWEAYCRGQTKKQK